MTTIRKIQVKSGAALSLSSQVRIIAIDIHGHGGSSIVNQPIDLDTMAEDYYDLVQQLGIGPAVWGGVSMGRITSLRIALRHPEAVLGAAEYEANVGQSGYSRPD
jgi:pimeloyl-ACP methyl ester carboxylesterase